MQILTTKDGKKIKYENGRAEVVDVNELSSIKKDIEARIEADKPILDKELLAWAKLNYPFTDHSVEQKELDRINSILEAIK